MKKNVSDDNNNNMFTKSDEPQATSQTQQSQEKPDPHPEVSGIVTYTSPSDSAPHLKLNRANITAAHHKHVTHSPLG